MNLAVWWLICLYRSTTSSQQHLIIEFPRASPAHGQRIVAAHLDRMEALLKQELTRIAAAEKERR